VEQDTKGLQGLKELKVHKRQTEDKVPKEQVVLKDSKVLLEDKVRKGVLVPKELKVPKVP
jgi:hypothetical protein